MTRPLIVVGAGGHGRVVADAAQAAGREVAAFADDRLAGTELRGVPVVAVADGALVVEARRLGAEIVVAVGDNARRREVHARLRAVGLALATVVHPRAVVLGGSQLGAGTVILANAVVGVDSVVGEGVIVNTSASIDHDNEVGDFAHLSPGAHCGGQVKIGAGVHLAVGVSVRNLMSIGAWSVVGVGAAVVSDIPSGVVAYGVPARVVRQA